MKISRLIIDSPELIQLAEQVSKFMTPDYTNHSSEMIIVASEVFKLRTSSDQWNMVTLKLVDSKIHVDILGVGGKSGFLGLSLGSESGFVKSMTRQLNFICDLNKYTLQNRIE
jgi:hypothetical protein